MDGRPNDVDVDIDREPAGRYGLNVYDVQSVVSAAIGGEDIGETVDGLSERLERLSVRARIGAIKAVEDRFHVAQQ